MFLSKTLSRPLSLTWAFTSTLTSTLTPSRPAAPSDEQATDPHECRCGHLAHAHEHYRRGSECALCPCPRFRDTAPVVRRRRTPRDRYGAG